MTNLDKYLSEVEQRAQKATPGEWKHAHCERDGSHYDCIFGPKGTDCSSPLIAEIFDSEAGCANFEFAAHARTDIPRLLSIIRQQREALLELSRVEGLGLGTKRVAYRHAAQAVSERVLRGEEQG